ncbi:MAG: NAD(P)-dependent oxidoreductase [Candidatus Syntrophosphaera sp.]|nr:NAD(P)-dependent oxidoreductase [Candidatus Syntrophosphaera sp.]
MRIAVTGANGFVGSNLANYFHTLGNDVLAIVRPHSDTSLLDPAIPVFRTDYGSEDELAEALAETEILIHNAGSLRTRTFEQMVAANVVTTRTVLRAFNRSPKGRRLVFISSQAASRPSRGSEQVTEEDPSAPVDWYGRSKLLAERLIRAECVKEWVILRPVPVYGPGERDFFKIFKAVKAGVTFRIGRKEQYLNLIHTDELCVLMGYCCELEQAAGQVFFAADGEVYTHSRFMASVAEILGVKPRDIVIPVPLAVIAFHTGELFERITGRSTLVNKQKMKELVNVNWVCSIDKARKILGWHPQPDLEGNLRKTFDWYRRKGWL